MSDDASYPPVSPFSSGIRGRCPRCGQGALFSGFLQTAPSCGVCRLDYGFADTGDGPAVFIMLIVGFIVVGAALTVEVLYQPPYWVHGILWLPLTAALCLGMLRPFKATLLALQYRNRAQEGRLASD
ncbi:MAG: DUF983 domain-containing protein [Methyloligellaceae bacterium]